MSLESPEATKTEPISTPPGTASQEELRQFVSSVSHDLQAPLRAVVGFSELLADRAADKLGDDEKRYLGIVRDSAKRAQAMIGELAFYSRLRAKPGIAETVSVEELLTVVTKRLKSAVDEARAEITCGPLPEIHAIRSRLEIVLHNLVHNALTFRGEAAPLIEISSRRVEHPPGQGGEESAHGSWEFCIRDNGIGIDPKHAERIFDVFQRLHTREEYPGLGMGLAVARRIIEDHGGTIWVEVSPTDGSDFRFLLPA